MVQQYGVDTNRYSSVYEWCVLAGRRDGWFLEVEL